MNREEIFKREDGSRVKLTCSIRYDWMTTKPRYDLSAWICEPRKRTFRNVHQDCYAWRALDREGRQRFELDEIRQVVSQAEIDAIKLALWQDCKPDVIGR